MAAALCLSLTIAAQGNRPGLDSILGQLSKAQYVAVLQAMNSGLLDSAFSLSSAIYAKARQSNDSEYIVKSTIVMGNIASRRQDYPASRNFYHIAEQYASNKADKLRIAGCSILKAVLDAPSDIPACVLALRLGKGTVDREIIPQITIPAVDSFFLEKHIHIQVLKFPEDLEHFQRIPPEPAHGFYQDHIDLAVPAAIQKSLKFLAALYAQPGGFFCKNAGVYPSRSAFDPLCIVSDLKVQAGFLFRAFRTDAAISGYPKRRLLFLLFLCAGRSNSCDDTQPKSLPHVFSSL